MLSEKKKSYDHTSYSATSNSKEQLVMSCTALVGITITLVVILANKSTQKLVTGTRNKFQMEIPGRRFMESTWPIPGCTSEVMCAASCHPSDYCIGFQYRKASPSESHGRCELLELGFDSSATFPDPDCNIFLKVSIETLSTTPAIMECKPLDSPKDACRGQTEKKMNSNFGNCSYTDGDKQTRFYLFDHYQQTWNGAKDFCFIQELVQVDIKDIQTQCIVQNMIKGMQKFYNPENFTNLAFTLGLHKNSNENWKFSDNGVFTDFPEFFVGKDSVNDELCAFVRIVGGENIEYMTVPCDTNELNGINFYPMCTDP